MAGLMDHFSCLSQVVQEGEAIEGKPLILKDLHWRTQEELNL